MTNQAEQLTNRTTWHGGEVILTWDPAAKPLSHLITSVHSFCFDNGQLLIAKLDHRGWDFPGGHIEEGETPLEALERELMEETSVEGRHELLGYIIVDHSENKNWNNSSPYPLIGYQAFYRSTLTTQHPFEGEYESSDRCFIPPSEVANYCKGMLPIHLDILREAIQKNAAGE